MQRVTEARPWGSWKVIDRGDGYQVKAVSVDPGRRLSYQSHAHRAEHWFVARGTATCTIDDATVYLEPGESVDVGVGVKHRIANDADVALVVIEVQSGSHLAEADIVRYEDDFGRVRPQWITGMSAAG